MHKIETTSYGCRISAWGAMDVPDVERLKCDILSALSDQTRPFSLIIDIRNLIPVSPEALDGMAGIEAMCREMSIIRAALIFSSPVIREQAKRVSHAAKTMGINRLIDASRLEDWEEQALAWVKHGVEPTGSMQTSEAR